MKTFNFRIKDSTHTNWLKSKAGLVNRAWNLAQEERLNHLQTEGKWLNAFALQKLVKVEGLHSHSTQSVVKRYVQSCIQHKKSKLKWRHGSKNLGWIPVSNQALSFDAETGSFRFMKRSFKTFYSRPVQGRILTASLAEDSLGRWYINVTTDLEEILPNGPAELGIDLGLKDQIVCSDGSNYSRPNLTKEFASKLATAQRAGHKKRTKKIHAKVRNKRVDWTHKVTTDLCSRASLIVVGDISSSKLGKTRLAKGIYDAAHGLIKTQLKYKAIRHSVEFYLTDERFTTVTCSVCLKRTGPSGLGGLSIRRWKCPCGAVHDRDVNAAKNILASLTGMSGQRGIPGL